MLNYDAILNMCHSVSQVKGLSLGSTKGALQRSKERHAEMQT